MSTDLPVAALRRARQFAVSVLLTAAAVALPGPAAALTQSWGGYHWSRTGNLAIGLGDNVGSAWDGYLRTAAAQWSADPVIDFVVTAGATSASSCGALYASVQVCNANYGASGWLGIASIWANGSHIVQGTVKLNDYYFGQTRYNTTAWRSMVTCQEIGHTLGLDHTNTIFTNLNTGSCMDYTNDPSGTRGTNGTLANTQPNNVDFAALAGIYAHLDGTQLAQTKPSWFGLHAFNIDGSQSEFGFSLVPEPESWAMMMIGFGLAGAVMRRRAGLQPAR